MIQRRAVVGIVCAASISLLTACGFQAPAVTDHEHSEVQGASFSVGTMRVRAAAITTPDTLASDSTSYVVVTFVNDGTATDTLTSITSPDGTITISGGNGIGGNTLTIPAGVVTPPQLVDPAIGVSGPTATFASAKVPVVGTFVPVTFHFQNAGDSTTQQVPVVPEGESTSPTVVLPAGTATPPPVSGAETND